MNREKMLNITYITGMAITVLATALGVLQFDFAKYILILGVLPIVTARGINQYNSTEAFSRIPLILFVSSLVLIAAVVALFLQRNYWVLLIFVSAVIDLYATFRAPKN